MAHFVRVLRTKEIGDHKAIVILTKHTGSHNTNIMLQMFEDVYVVPVPDDDHGLVSLKTLQSLSINAASNIILTAQSGNSTHDIAKMDHHQMCIRMVTLAYPHNTASCIVQAQVFTSPQYK